LKTVKGRLKKLKMLLLKGFVLEAKNFFFKSAALSNCDVLKKRNILTPFRLLISSFNFLFKILKS